MIVQKLKIEKLTTDRLILIPYTIKICRNILKNDFSDLYKLNLLKGKSWPDEDALESLPRIYNHLSKVEAPTGFESWMIIKKDSREIIGDLGFKGFHYEEENIDLGYGIIKEERRKGFTEEAAREIIEWAFATGLVKEITANCLKENISSINLLKKLDFIQIKEEEELIYWVLNRRDRKK